MGMKTTFITVVPVYSQPLGHFRSVPAQMDSTCPAMKDKDPRPMEHPQDMSSVAATEILPMEPTNGSILAI